jgi:hypothetical protein
MDAEALAVSDAFGKVGVFGPVGVFWALHVNNSNQSSRHVTHILNSLSRLSIEK